jgi:hypothetical protein
MLNLEINGPGQAVYMEMENLKRTASQMSNGAGKGLMDVVGNIQNYLYKRIDSFGLPSAIHWKTTYDTKERMMNFYKDCFERGTSVISSTALIDEMCNVIRQDGSLGAPGRGKDDRVIAAALAHIAWIDYIRMRLVPVGITRASSRRSDDANSENPVNNVSKYLKERGIVVT